ncbi:MAG: ubiquinol-cytochrome c reductase iron-sulfur subunit [Deltaproteobacteria bacterium]|nr:MAG: ubiquinol-cytochrome c reductase iron-sulfur subunit [Deltaproteobacteria bacterium]
MANLELLRQEGCDPSQHIWSRRNFIGLMGWGAVLGSLGVGTLAFGRYMYPRVLFEPRMAFKVGKPEAYRINDVSEEWIEKYRFWIVRTTEGFFALSGICTHLGCTPRWLASENKFKCPCHGSGYRGIDPSDPYPGITGINFEGPAPRPLERYKIGLAEDGQLIVDKSVAFRQEKGEWTKPDAFLKYTG